MASKILSELAASAETVAIIIKLAVMPALTIEGVTLQSRLYMREGYLKVTDQRFLPFYTGAFSHL